MKTIHQLVLAALLVAPAFAQAQSRERRTTVTREERTSVKLRSPQNSRKDSSDVTAILKDSANAETGPILNDNGTVSSTGTVDGSRSSTGRPDADTVTTFSSRKTKIKAVPDSSRRKSRRP